MSFLDKLLRIASSAAAEWKKEESFVKGEDFEHYLLDYTFPDNEYELIYRTSSYQDNQHRYATASKLPDLRLRCRKTGRHFYVEAKFRNGMYWHNDKLEWTNPNQLARYKQVDEQDAPVFLALGIGDAGFNPEFVFIIPLNKVSYCGFYEHFLQRYSFYLKRPIYSSYLWKLRY